MKYLINTGYTGKSTPTPLYANNKKDIQYVDYKYVCFFSIPIHIMVKIGRVPCVSFPLSIVGGLIQQ